MSGHVVTAAESAMTEELLSCPGSVKRKGGECNGDANANSELSMHTDDYECDCDTCLLGFDDSNPGEVREGPPVKRTAVNIFLYCIYLFMCVLNNLTIFISVYVW